MIVLPKGTSTDCKDMIELKRKVAERDNHTCQICGRHTEEVDHFIPWKDGGEHSMANLWLLCRSCNSRKGGRTDIDHIKKLFKDRGLTFIPGNWCNRCGNRWHSKIRNPKMCPHCKSPYWNKKRIRKGEG